MQEMNKIILIMILAIFMCLLGFSLKGLFGAVMGFLLTLIIFGFFVIWKKYTN